MTLSPVLLTFFLGACLLGFILPLLGAGFKAQFKFQINQAQVSSLALGLPLILLAYVLMFLMKLDAAHTVLFASGGFLGSWVLSCLNFSAGLAGIPLLLAGYWIAGMNTDPLQAQMPLIAYTLGLLIAKTLTPSSKLSDLLLPAIFCVGSYWITLSSPEGWVVTYQTLLILALSIVLIVRGLQALPIIPANPWLRGTFVTVVTGLAAWLGIQNLLFQPGLPHWAWLFAGGSLLGFLFGENENATEPRPVLQGAIQLVLVGIAALIASRLFGTVGWLVLAAMVLANPKASRIAGVVSLFFIGRALLQGFIYQFNPNVTGINITHPYASAALYGGVAAMLILPAFLNLNATQPEKGDSRSIQELAVPVALGLFTAGLSNYFLHAEATGSLLTALLTAGLGVSLLGRFSAQSKRAYPLLLSLLVTSGSLLANELIDIGNNAEKPEKLWVLGGALVFFLIFFAVSQKNVSGRETVQIS